MPDISDLPLSQFASGKLFAGGDDLVRMEDARVELQAKRDAIAKQFSFSPEAKRRKLDSADRHLDLLGRAIIVQRELVRSDPHRDKAYVALRTEQNRAKQMLERESERVKDKADPVKLGEIARTDSLLTGHAGAEVAMSEQEHDKLQTTPAQPKSEKLYPIDAKVPPAAAVGYRDDDRWLNGGKPGDGDISGR